MLTLHGQKFSDDVSKEVSVQNGYNFTTEVHEEPYHEYGMVRDEEAPSKYHHVCVSKDEAAVYNG